jgi:diadenosine tetraphosphate (Ap4A) HIT family hydrolase
MIQLNKDEALEQLEAYQRRVEREAGASCLMCHLADGHGDGGVIAESEHGVVLLDGFGATEGHLLVVARRHVERASDLEWSVFVDLQRLVWEATRVVEAVLQPARVYTAALGASAKLPTSYPHFHVHVVPVYAADERARPAHVFSWSSGVVRYETAEAARIVARLREAWRHATAEPGAAPARPREPLSEALTHERPVGVVVVVPAARPVDVRPVLAAVGGVGLSRIPA